MAWQDAEFQLGMSLTAALEFVPPAAVNPIPLKTRLAGVDHVTSLEQLRALCEEAAQFISSMSEPKKRKRA